MPARQPARLPGLDDGPTRGDRVAADWRETILDKVEVKARERRNRNGKIRDAKLVMNVGMGFARALNEAAERRGISRVGYLRRAVAAFLAADLGVPFESIARECPAPTPFTRERAWVTGTGDDDGRGFGTWVVPGGQTDPAGPVERV
jgi:hypothetical protein